MSSLALFQLRNAAKAGFKQSSFVSRRLIPSISSTRPYLTTTDGLSTFSSAANKQKYGIHRFFSSDDLNVHAPTSNHPYTPLPGAKGSIIYTETDEAPALATYSFLPVLRKVSLFLPGFTEFSTY